MPAGAASHYALGARWWGRRRRRALRAARDARCKARFALLLRARVGRVSADIMCASVRRNACVPLQHVQCACRRGAPLEPIKIRRGDEQDSLLSKNLRGGFLRVCHLHFDLDGRSAGSTPCLRRRRGGDGRVMRAHFSIPNPNSRFSFHRGLAVRVIPHFCVQITE